MFGSMAFKLGMLAKKDGGGADVIPNAINWSNIGYNGILGDFTYTEKQITGINQTITLKVTQSTNIIDMYYGVNTAINGDYERFDYGDLEGRVTAFDPSIFGLTNIANNGTFTVSNNDWICFACQGGTTINITVTIKNNSDGDSTLDTFTADIVAI
jgi:hypothetical protein